MAKFSADKGRQRLLELSRLSPNANSGNGGRRTLSAKRKPAQGSEDAVLQMRDMAVQSLKAPGARSVFR
ncbi:MAG: hypothetical protein BM562_14085 [Alphaproteobacteria bacterium MedPE-SWcel]|nr:MAG: hypothetical protein BM562_14085 [Alphaproteobacteria bacterium MedPE-SWcel]